MEADRGGRELLMEITGNPPDKQSNQEKRFDEALVGISVPWKTICLITDLVKQDWIASGFRGRTWDVLGRRGHAIWAERQYKRRNSLHPDWPFYTDFRLCMATPRLEGLFRKASLDPVTDINVEVDGAQHGGMNERERDYRKDRDCFTPTIRWGPQALFKDAKRCAAVSITKLLIRHFTQMYVVAHVLERIVEKHVSRALKGESYKVVVAGFQQDFESVNY